MTAQRGRRPVTDFQSEKFMDRRGFLKELGLVGGSGMLLAMFPWLQSCSDEARREVAGEKARLAIVGTGSRGPYHIQNLLKPRSSRCAISIRPTWLKPRRSAPVPNAIPISTNCSKIRMYRAS